MKRETRQEHNPVESMSEEAATLASSLAPPEEQKEAMAPGNGKRNGGSILIDTARLTIPKGFIDQEKRKSSFRLEPVVIFILLMLLSFIAVIAYLISIEPS